MFIEAQAGGLRDGHAAADFSPSSSLPTDFVRLRDSFQNTDKKNFGFTIMLTAAPSEPNPARVSRAVPLGLPRNKNEPSVKRAAGNALLRERARQSR
jgi:hypothetical protein